MGHSKNNKNPTTKLGQVKKETREERRTRILAEASAREVCFKILPQAGGFVLFLVLAFYLWARSVPAPSSSITKPQQLNPMQQQQKTMNMEFSPGFIAATTTSGINKNEKNTSPKMAPRKDDSDEDMTIEL